MELKKILRISTTAYAVFFTLLGIFILYLGVFVSPNPNKFMYFLACFVLMVHGEMIWVFSFVIDYLLEDREILINQQESDEIEEQKNRSHAFLSMN